VKHLSPTLILLILSITLSAQTAPNINPDLLSFRWPADWIGHTEGPYRDFGVFHFRKSFDLESVPDSFVIHVSSDNRYRLFVNGSSVSLGPARSDLDHWRFETIDIAPQLRPGRNVLAAVVWNFGIWSPMAQLSERTAFILQGDGEQEQLVNTSPDNGWKSVQDTAYKPIPIPRSAVPYFYVVGPGLHVDASLHPWGWEQPDFDDSSWSDVRSWGPGQANELFQWNEDRWLLTPRPIPPMEETPERLEKLVRFNGLDASQAFVKGHAPIRVPANTSAVVLFDRGHLTTAYPELTVTGGKGAEIKLTYAESLRDAEGNKGNRNETEGKQIRSNYDIFVADGEHRVLKTLFWRTYRYLQFDIQTGDAPLEILDYQGVFTAYPVGRTATFESPSQELQRMLEIGWRTQRVCMNETYFDTPQYEQLAYAGDGRLQSITTYTNLWDDRLNRNHLEQFWYSMRPEGLIQDRYPSREPQYIPGYALDWIASIHDFYLYRDDPGFLKKFLPATRGVLDWFEQRIDENGLLNHLSWYDTQYEGPDHMSFNQRFVQELAFIIALQQAEELELALGSKDQALHYRTLIPRLKQAVFEALWSPRKGMLADSPDKTDFSVEVNALGVLSDVIPHELQRTALETALDPSSGARPIGSFFKHYVPMLAMGKTGLGDRFLSMLDPWREQMRAGFTTWGENPGMEPRSDSHSWSSVPNSQVFMLLAGIRPAAPGFHKVSIRPHLNGLHWVKATVPHPQGEIRVELAVVGDSGLKAEVVLPEGVTGWFEWGNQTLPLHGGHQSLSF
jgi:alpha-L-rhamnosidase